MTNLRGEDRTLAVLLGDGRTRLLYQVLVAVPLLVSVGVAAVGNQPLAALGLIAALLLFGPVRRIRSGAAGLALIPVLRDTGLAMLLWAAVTGVALAMH